MFRSSHLRIHDVTPAAADERASISTATLVVGGTLAVAAVFVAFFELGDYRALTDHEAYAAVPAREMLATGDWVVPRFGGLPRLEKPPLVYWLIAGTSWVVGRTDAWAARLPSTLAMLGLVLLMAHWAGRRFGPAGALGAAAAQLSSAYVLAFGRKAEVDMVLCLLTTSALYLVAHQPEREAPGRSAQRWLAIHLLLGLAFLAKFHYGLAMVLGPWVVFQLVQRTPRRLLPALRPAGLLLLAACVGVWPALVLLREPAAAATWWHETVHRALPGVFEDQPVWFYLPHLASLTLPWLPVALLSVRPCWRRAWKRGDPADRFLWIWFGVQLALMTISANKHRHYLMAALPVFSLLVGETVARWTRLRNSSAAPLLSTRTAFRGSLVVAAVAWFAHVRAVAARPEFAATFAPIALLVAGLFAVVLALFVLRKEIAATVVAAVGFVAIHGIVQGELSPALDQRRELVRFSQEARRYVGHRMLHVFDLGMTPTVFYLGTPVRRIERLEDVHALQGDEPVYVFTSLGRASDIVLGAPGYVVARQLPTPETEGIEVGKTLILVEIFPRGRTTAIDRAPAL